MASQLPCATAPVFDQPAFARALRVRVAELGITSSAAAAAAGVSTSTFSRVSRQWTPDLESYLRLTAWLARTAAENAK